MSNILANNINPRSGNKITIGNVNTTVAIAGTATYEDVTSIDSVGIITARSGVNVTGGQLNVGSNIKIGNAGVITATSFSGDGSALTGIGGTANVSTNTLSVSGVSTLTGDINSGSAIYFSNIVAPSAGGSVKIYATTEGGANNGTLTLDGRDKITFIEDGFVRWIIENGALETHGTTYNNLGNASASGGRVGNGYFQTSVDLIDNGELRLGTGDDLKLYHDGTHSYITCDGGNLKIQSTNLDDIQILNDQQTSIVKTDFSAYSATFRPSTSVDLYYGGSKKFETVTNGIKVTGRVFLGGSTNGGFDYNSTADTLEFLTTNGGTHSELNSAAFVPSSDAGKDLGNHNKRWDSIYCTGVAFGGNTDAAATLLDDYEEGSWTPTNSDVSITTSSGYYIKIGRLVTITARINFPTNSNSSTTNIGGLPFAVDDNLSNSAMGGAVGETTYTGSDRPMAAVEVSDVIRFRINGGTSMTNANWSNKSVRFSLTYFSTS